MFLSGPSDIAVILVGYNSQRHLGPCLEALFRSQLGPYSASVVYVDNASKDDSVSLVRNFDHRIQVMANESNVGFCEACNQATRATESRFLYLLNNDTIPQPDSIRLLAEFLDRQPNAGAAGNRLLNPDRSDQWSARRFPVGVNALFGRRTSLAKVLPNSRWVRNYLYKDQMGGKDPFPVDWIPGSCTLVRREVYWQAGGLPADMHYWSDAVFCSRIRRAGWEIYTVPTAPLIHDEGNGSGPLDATLRRRLIEDFHQGAYRFYQEHYGLQPGSLRDWIARNGLRLRAQALQLAKR